LDKCLVQVAIGSWDFFFTRISRLKKPFGAKPGETLWIRAPLVKQKEWSIEKYGDTKSSAKKVG
jgi:hypothetical protein